MPVVLDVLGTSRSFCSAYFARFKLGGVWVCRYNVSDSRAQPGTQHTIKGTDAALLLSKEIDTHIHTHVHTHEKGNNKRDSLML